MEPCTASNRLHKWTFIKNLIRTSHMGRSARISKVGIYKCDLCGQKKYGPSNINED